MDGDPTRLLPGPAAPVEDARTRLLEARLRTRTALGALRTEVATRADWREWYQARPVACLAVAFFAGFLLARRR